MALKTFVKISNVNNLSDARYCSGMYVNLIGFSLEENNEYYVSPDQFKEITDWLSGLKYVAEFRESHPENILKTLSDYIGFDLIQFEEFAHLQMLYNSGYPLIYKAMVTSDSDLESLQELAGTLAEHKIILNLESDHNLPLNPQILKAIKELGSKCEVLLGFGFDSDNIIEILQDTQVTGISMKGGHEIKPGIKDFDELADILEALEIED